MNEAAKSSTSWISSVKGLWAVWGIQHLVALTIACNIVLTICGSRRKYKRSTLCNLIIWAAYLLLPYCATVALGNLSVIRIDDPENPGYDVVLEGLLAPLLLMQLGYADGMTAFAVEDDRLGWRQMLNTVVTVGVVVWILFHCWDSSSPMSRLSILLSVAGIIKSVGWARALQSVYDENSSVTAENMSEDAYIEQVFQAIPKSEKFASTKEILKAYYRFNCLKPHLVNSMYHPSFMSSEWLSIEGYPADRTFTMTEIELNFMFDVLYTKAPILYTKCGLVARFVGVFCLVSALCGFAMIFKSIFLIDMYFTYTYALLMAVTSLELYQIVTLVLSDWAVVMMCKDLGVLHFQRLLPPLADWCMKKKRWSGTMGQLNLLHRHLLYEGCRKHVGNFLSWLGDEEFFMRCRRSDSVFLPSSLKELVVEKMTELEKKRHLQPFKERGMWTLETHGIQENQTLSHSIATEFDKSIIIWHVATEILHTLESEDSDACRGSKLLSGYMMYLLAVCPYVLFLKTTDITLEHACHALSTLLRNRDISEAIGKLLAADGNVTDPVGSNKATIITQDWHVMSEVRKLVDELRRMDDKWEIISSIWVEMLCYAAYNCHVYYHGQLLRRGGEFITHVWLLLAHKTDKYHLRIPKGSGNLPLPQTFPVKDSSSCCHRNFGKRNARTRYGNLLI